MSVQAVAGPTHSFGFIIYCKVNGFSEDEVSALEWNFTALNEFASAAYASLRAW